MTDVVVAAGGETSVEVVLPEGLKLSAAVLLRLVVGRWGGRRWRPAIRRLHE